MSFYFSKIYEKEISNVIELEILKYQYFHGGKKKSILIWVHMYL